MYDSLLLLLMIGAGIFAGARWPRWLGAYKWLQGGAAVVLLFSMGIAMRAFTGDGAVAGVCLSGVAIGLATVAGSVIAAHIYRRVIHKGESL